MPAAEGDVVVVDVAVVPFIPETFSPKSFAVSKRFTNFALALPISLGESGGAKFLWVINISVGYYSRCSETCR